MWRQGVSSASCSLLLLPLPALTSRTVETTARNTAGNLDLAFWHRDSRGVRERGREYRLGSRRLGSGHRGEISIPPGQLTEGAKPPLGGCRAAHLVAVRSTGRAACSGDRRSATRTSAGIRAARASAQPGLGPRGSVVSRSENAGSTAGWRSLRTPRVGFALARGLASRRRDGLARRTPPRRASPTCIRAAGASRSGRADWLANRACCTYALPQ